MPKCIRFSSIFLILFASFVLGCLLGDIIRGVTVSLSDF